CLSPIQQGEIPFCYDYPSKRMMAIYARLGMSPVGQIRRFAKLLRVDRKVREIFGDSAPARSLSAIGNQVLALSARRSRSVKGCEISLHQGRFGDEFSELYQRIAGRYKVCGHRTAAYLNWRYLETPLHRYE